MPTFAYTGRTRAGQTVSGERVADSVDAATAALRREQINVTRITPAKAAAEEGAKKAKTGKAGKKVAAKNLAVFTRQFSVMIDAGLPLVQCLDILGSQEEDKNFAFVIGETRKDVEAGASLADAMRKHPKTFDPLFTNMIAAGEAGLGMAIRLRPAGVEYFVVLERAADVGGTWWANTYPGCQCDIPSHLYSFSFAPNPDWTRTYPKQPELRDYLRSTAERCGVYDRVRLDTEVTDATWDAAAGRWRLTTSQGPYSADVLIAAPGPLSEP